MAQLRRLHDVVPDVVRWRHSLAVIDDSGRVRLPVYARPREDEPPELVVSSRDRSLVLRRDGVGDRRRVDPRGRLLVPHWLRELAGGGGEVVVSASLSDPAVVVVAPVAVLDVLVEGLAGEAH